MAKHPVPKKKTSKARTSRRYKSFQNRARMLLSTANPLMNCSNCSAVHVAHTVCPSCGYYRGKQTLVTSQTEITTISAD